MKSFLSSSFIPAALVILHFALPCLVASVDPLLPSGCSAANPVAAGINMGPPNEPVGPYGAMENKVQLPGSLTVIPLRGTISNTFYPAVFSKHFRYRRLGFSVKVPPLSAFRVTVLTAEYKFCYYGGVTAFMFAGTNNVITPKINGYRTYGCRVAFNLTVDSALSTADGTLNIKVVGSLPVVIAGLYIERKLMEPSGCSQSGCVSYHGCGGLAVTWGDLAIPGKPCAILSSASGTLTLPRGAEVKYAALNWAGAGHPRSSSTTIVLNGITIQSDVLHEDQQFEPYYTAMADITSVVQRFGSGDYVVTSLFHRPYLSCPQAHMAAWSITVIYGARTRANTGETRVNMCAQNTLGTPPLLSLPVRCIAPPSLTSVTRGTFVVFEGEYFSDIFLMNGVKIVRNAFQGRTGEKFDLYQIDLTSFVKSTDTEFDFSVVNNPDNDYLFFGMRAVAQTMAI